ncbi:MAG: DUF2608 domain-containing protein [Lysobacterales bacterium]
MKNSDTSAATVSARNIVGAASAAIPPHAAPTISAQHRRIFSTLALSLLLAQLSACKTAPTHEPPPAANPNACAGIPIIEVPATAERGSTTIRCITSYTGNTDLLNTLKLDSLLLVLDIDDTLLTSDTFFGSDRWYEWQTSKDIDPKDKVRCLFDVIALNYEAGTQHAVEGDAGSAFISKLKVPKLLLTSRSAHARGGTERELLHAKYELPINLMPSNHGSSWINVRSGKPAPISYANGIQMVTGRDKGQSLLDLLTFLKLHYDNIVLVDDGEANITSLRQALPAAGINYYGFHYKGVDKSFDEDDKDQARAAWGSWSELMEKRYPNRWVRWGEKDGTGCGR